MISYLQFTIMMKTICSMKKHQFCLYTFTKEYNYLTIHQISVVPITEMRTKISGIFKNGKVLESKSENTEF